MKCLSKGLLRAYLDGELDVAEREAVERHMAQCARCERAAHLAATADATRSRLNAVAPPAEPDIESALLRARSLVRQGAAETRGERSFAMGNKSTWRPALAGGLVLLLLLSALSFEPGRALARQVLSVFRVRRFAVVQVNPDQSQVEAVARQLEDTLFVGEPEVVEEPAEIAVASIQEASAEAGFAARMPEYLPGSGNPRITVRGRSEYAWRFRGDGLRLLLELAGMDPAAVPAELDEGEVRATAGASVTIARDGLTVYQIADPSATYPDNLDPAVVVEAGLRILSVSPEEARRLSQRFDWETTLLVPVLADAGEFRETEVAGADALLVRGRDGEGASRERATLLMERDGILYIVEGQASFERLVQVAQSMF